MDGMDKNKTFLIVGLGLLGGKYAQVLSQNGYRVTGITPVSYTHLATLGTRRSQAEVRAGQPGRAPSGSRLRMHRAVLFQATKKRCV